MQLKELALSYSLLPYAALLTNLLCRAPKMLDF